MTDHPDTFVKAHHVAGCEGDLYRLPSTVCIDRIGRQGNGGIVVHVYRCNRRWKGCGAMVYVTEHALRMIAVQAEKGSVNAPSDHSPHPG